MKLSKKWEGYSISEQLEIKGLRIILFDSHQFKLIPAESVSNIIATRNDNRLLWEAEPPTTKYDIYFRIYLQDDKLMAMSGGGQLHELDLVTGEIINSLMTK